MGAIAIGQEPGRDRSRWQLITVGVLALVVILAMASSQIEVDTDSDSESDPNDPDQCLTARTMIREIDADIQEYTALMASTYNPIADAYYLTQIARLEVEKKYIEYVYGCTSRFGDL